MNFNTASTVIFDLDGTLIDSAPVVASVLNDMRVQSGKKPLDLDFFRVHISRGATELVSTSLDIDAGDAEDYVSEFRHNYFNLPTPLSCLYEGALDTLKNLSASGINLAICSNKPEHLCKKILAETSIGEIVNIVIGGDTLSVSKPCKEPIDYAIQLCGGEHKSSILVGDSTVDQRAAIAAGIPFVFYRHGYDDGVDEIKALHVIDRIPELLTIDSLKRARGNGARALI